MATFDRMALRVVAAGALMCVAGYVQAETESTACCPGEPHGAPLAKTGVGLSAPLTSDVSQASTWNVYEFEREGIYYLQVNDRSGRVRAVIGNIGEEFWAVPMGTDVERVSTPQRRLPIPAGAKRIEVLRRPYSVLAAYETAGGVIWSIEAPDGTR